MGPVLLLLGAPDVRHLAGRGLFRGLTLAWLPILTFLSKRIIFLDFSLQWGLLSRKNVSQQLWILGTLRHTLNSELGNFRAHHCPTE